MPSEQFLHCDVIVGEDTRFHSWERSAHKGNLKAVVGSGIFFKRSKIGFEIKYFYGYAFYRFSKKRWSLKIAKKSSHIFNRLSLQLWQDELKMLMYKASKLEQIFSRPWCLILKQCLPLALLRQWPVTRLLTGYTDTGHFHYWTVGPHG